MNSDNEDRDNFENSYCYFIHSLEVLAAPPEDACELLGNFNVSFETKFDIEAGTYLFNFAYCPFSLEQRNTINILMENLREIPVDVLAYTEAPSKSLENMKHPCWIPLRKKAKNLLDLLSPITKRNQEYFDSGNS